MTSNDPQTNPVICIFEEQIELTIDDLCRACAVQTQTIIELVEEGVLDAAGPAPQDWRFGGDNLRRARVALRLQQDLGVNPAGAALILQLMQEIDALRSRLHALGEYGCLRRKNR